MRSDGSARFFGWKVVWAAFTVAVFGWGMAFYGPPVYLHALQASRGWSVGLVSAALTVHFLVGSLAVANLPAIHARLGVAATTRAGAAALALGTLGWALAVEPWQLFAATLLSGMGWAATGAVAINAFVSPWFVVRRPAALALAYNGASVGGILFPPLLAALIAGLGFCAAALMAAAATLAVIWVLAGRYLAPTPESLGQHPDGIATRASAVGAMPGTLPPLPGRALWASPTFLTFTAGFSIALFAQAGLIAHLFSLLVPALGETGAGLASGLAAFCAVVGRTALGWMLGPATDRRRAGALALVMQACGCGAFLLAGGQPGLLIMLGVVLFGLGIGIAITIGPLIAQAELAASDVGRAIALATAVSQAAYAFAPAAFGLLREWSAAPGRADAMGDAAFFAVAAALQLIAAAVYLSRRGRG